MKKMKLLFVFGILFCNLLTTQVQASHGVSQENLPKKSQNVISMADKWKYEGIAIEEPGYHLWGSSPIWGEDGKVHIFTTRWRIEHQFDLPLWSESMVGFISKGKAEECIVYIGG